MFVSEYLSSSCDRACTINSFAQTRGTVPALMARRDEPMIPPPKAFIIIVFICLRSEGSSYTNGSPAHSIFTTWASVISLMADVCCPMAETQMSDAVVLPMFFVPKAIGMWQLLYLLTTYLYIKEITVAPAHA